MFIVDLAVFVVGSAAQFFVAEAWQLFVIRLVMGMAIGADYAIGWPLLAEFSPARLRGRLLSFQEVAWYIGYLFSYAPGYYMSSAVQADWRIISISASLASVRSRGRARRQQREPFQSKCPWQARRAPTAQVQCSINI